MAFWWVNQGQTYNEERDGSYLWSPKRARNGSRRAFYDAMTRVAVDDVIFHYVSKPYASVVALSVVVEPARSTMQPEELQRTEMWADDGWLLPVAHVEDVRSVLKEDALQLGRGEAPFTRNGRVNQGYLYELTDTYGQRLLALMDPAAATAFAEPATPQSEPRGAQTVSLEAGRRITFDQVVTPGRRAAVRTEWQLVDQLVADFSLARTRRRYRLSNGSELYADLWVESTGLLVEAKASAGRDAIRQAIGQLYDYADKEHRPVIKLVALPTRPLDDLLAVLKSADIRSVWRADDVWAGDIDASLWGPSHRDLEPPPRSAH